MSTDFSEDTLVEQPAIALFSELGYETANCFYEKVGGSSSTLGRETTEEVILLPKLRSALERLNPALDSARQFPWNVDSLGASKSLLHWR